VFNKITTSSIKFEDLEILDGDLLKTAALKLPDGITYDPDFLYMKVRGVSAGEYWGCNKNSDFFPEGELLSGYETFLTAHYFKNHENKDIKNAIGDVLAAEWNDKMKGVDLLLRLDRKIAPTIVRGFEKGFMTDVSMGCRIDHSVCSICGNKAKTKFEYCDHIKYQRGQILDNGKKVYEINIGPKFHDISAVLNGAERAAKVLGLMIIDNKVAYSCEESSIEKVASFEDSIREGQEKIAAPISHDVDFGDFFVKPGINKKANVNKIAEMKKEIQSKITDYAEGEFLAERQESAEELSDLIRILYTEYWSKDKCKNIANRIRYLAEKKGCPVEAAFHQFLRVLDFAGIVLSPLEVHDICCFLSGKDPVDFRGSVDEITDRNVMTSPERMDKATFENKDMDVPENLPSLLRAVFEKVMPKADRLGQIIGGEDLPRRMKAIIMSVATKTPEIKDEPLQEDIMKEIVQPMIEKRSMHREFLIPRLCKKASRNDSNINHFMPILSEKVATETLVDITNKVYAAYQKDRMDKLASGETQKGLDKFADDIVSASGMEKTAATWGLGKALMIGVPVTYGYSGYQRSRLRSGKNVHPLNRYIAEQPASAALIQAAFAPAIKKNINKIKSSDLAKSESAGQWVASKFASEELYGDIFKSAEIDTSMSKKYSRDQIDAIKVACILMASGEESLAQEKLASKRLSEEDIEHYLKEARDYIKIKIEKIADSETSKAKEVALGALTYSLFSPRGVSGLASLSGNVLDSYVTTKLFNRGPSKKEEKRVSNSLAQETNSKPMN